MLSDVVIITENTTFWFYTNFPIISSLFTHFLVYAYHHETTRHVLFPGHVGILGLRTSTHHPCHLWWLARGPKATETMSTPGDCSQSLSLCQVFRIQWSFIEYTLEIILTVGLCLRTCVLWAFDTNHCGITRLLVSDILKERGSLI